MFRFSRFCEIIFEMNIKKNTSNLLFFIYLLVVLLLGLLPLNAASALNDIYVINLRGDYFLHIFLFVPWMLLSPQKYHKIRIWLLGGLLFACSLEGIQYLLPYRTFNINDLIYNCVGVVIGWSMLLIAKKIHHMRKKKKVYLYK